jgi:hypothetical protein
MLLSMLDKLHDELAQKLCPCAFESCSAAAVESQWWRGSSGPKINRCAEHKTHPLPDEFVPEGAQFGAVDRGNPVCE